MTARGGGEPASRGALVALAGYGAALAASAPAWPDDWDGLGFLASVSDFDLARFHPHPPGYPVYVALLRVAAVVARSPMRAAVVVAAASGVAAAAFAWGAARRLGGARAGLGVAVGLAVAPLAWRACSGVGTEGPALACLAACAWGLVEGRRAEAGKGTGALALGAGAGLGLGVRLSWAPLYLAALALAPRAGRARAWVAAVVASASWAVPLVTIVGPSRLAGLYAEHLAGHASRWGGTVVTEPGWVRARWLARDVLVDGLGAGLDPLGLLVAGLCALAAAVALSAWRRAGWPWAGRALLLVGPYVAWIALGQNLRDQPRHALPVVALLAAACGATAAVGRRGPWLAAALVLAMSARTAQDAWARRTVPPPGQQLVDLARQQPAPDRTDVFGTTSLRFFEPTELAGQAFPAGSLGDVQVRLTRVNRLPARVWVTGEVQREASRWPLDPVATLCRPPRLDRRAPCLDVFRWRPPYLPAQ